MAYHGIEWLWRARRSASWHSAECHCVARHIIPFGRAENAADRVVRVGEIALARAFENRLPWQLWYDVDVFGPSNWHDVHGDAMAVHAMPRCAPPCSPTPFYAMFRPSKNRLPWQRWSGFDVFGLSKWHDMRGYAMAFHAVPRCAPPCSPTPFCAMVCHAVLALAESMYSSTPANANR